MKLRNKKTGEIRNVEIMGDNFLIEAKDYPNDTTIVIKSLAELNEEWEDYEEPKEYWFIDYDGGMIPFSKMKDTATDKLMKQIGNYFETKEEAEKAVRKLEAWKLLKDMGFKIEGIRFRNNKSYIEWTISQKTRDDHFMSEAFYEALHLVFGGGE